MATLATQDSKLETATIHSGAALVDTFIYFQLRRLLPVRRLRFPPPPRLFPLQHRRLRCSNHRRGVSSRFGRFPRLTLPERVKAVRVPRLKETKSGTPPLLKVSEARDGSGGVAELI